MHFSTSSPNKTARPDLDRQARKGVPEVIIAERKTAQQSIDIANQFLEATGRAILSRVPPALEERLRTDFEDLAHLDWFPAARAAVLRRPDMEQPQTGGRVGVITAGTSDIPWPKKRPFSAARWAVGSTQSLMWELRAFTACGNP